MLQFEKLYNSIKKQGLRGNYYNTVKSMSDAITYAMKLENPSLNIVELIYDLQEVMDKIFEPNDIINFNQCFRASSFC